VLAARLYKTFVLQWHFGFGNFWRDESGHGSVHNFVIMTYKATSIYDASIMESLANSTKGEWFSLACAANHAKIKAGSALCERYAKSLVQMGYLGDLVGHNIPQFALRLLWLQEEPMQELVIDAGYNTLVLSSVARAEPFRQSGLQVALEVTKCVPQDAKVDYLLCREGTFCEKLSDETSYERACRELRWLYNQTARPLIYVTNRSSEYQLALSHKVNRGSAVAFYAVRDGALHPLFSQLSKSSLAMQTRLLPLLEVEQFGAIADFPLESIEKVLGRQRQKRFCGAGCVTDSLSSSQEALFYCPIWLIGQRMWRAINVHALLEMWLESYHPEWQKVLEPAMIHRLFQLRSQEAIEAASGELQAFGKRLAETKEALRFQKKSPSLGALSQLLYLFQSAYKADLEKFCQERMQKIPLALQNFLPFSFSK